MRLQTLVLAGVLAAPSIVSAQQVANAPREVSSPLVFEIMVRRYSADNTMASAAGDGGTGRFESYVSLSSSLCGLSASNTAPTTLPGVGWHFSADVLSGSSGAMTARVEWQRLWEHGARLQNGPSGSQTITLRAGERIELDRVTPAGPSSCGAVEAKLEAAVASRLAYRLTTASGQLGAAVGRGGRGGIAGGTMTGVVSGAGRGGARGTTVAQGQQGQQGAQGQQGQRGQQGQQGQGVQGQGQQGRQGQQATTVVAGRGGRGGAAAGVTAGAQTTASGRGGMGVGAGRGSALSTQYSLALSGNAASYDAELWLVHRRPDGSETVQQQSIRVGRQGTQYTFPPVQVPTSRGVVTLDITGTLQGFVGDPPDPNQMNGRLVFIRKNFETPAGGAQAQRIMVSISRRARATGSPLLDITGGSSIAIDVPSASDVLSFEFPALQKATEDLLKGHLFSLRVRVTPAK